MINTKKGFTLIELLVVIAIIGILSSVVLASLNTARNKGADAAIKSQLAGIRAQAEILYDTTQCYVATGGTCAAAVAKGVGVCAATANTIFADSKFYSQIQAAITTSGAAYNNCVATVNGGAWAVAVPLKSPLLAWCVDSSGASKSFTLATQNQAGVDAAINASAVCQ